MSGSYEIQQSEEITRCQIYPRRQATPRGDCAGARGGRRPDGARGDHLSGDIVVDRLPRHLNRKRANGLSANHSPYPGGDERLVGVSPSTYVVFLCDFLFRLPGTHLRSGDILPSYGVFYLQEHLNGVLSWNHDHTIRVTEEKVSWINTNDTRQTPVDKDRFIDSGIPFSGALFETWDDCQGKLEKGE